MRIVQLGTYINEIWRTQIDFQKKVQCDNLCRLPRLGEHCEKPCSIPEQCTSAYKTALLCLYEELGELLQSDKRYRGVNDNVDSAAKNLEIVDVFLTFLNVCIFSGVEIDEILNKAIWKQQQNISRFKTRFLSEKGNQDNDE